MLLQRGSSLFLSHFISQVYRKGDLGDEVDGMKGDTIKLRSDDGGSRKRGVPCGPVLVSSSLFWILSDGEASFRSLSGAVDFCFL